MKNTTRKNSKKTIAKPSGKRKLAAKTIKNEKKNKFSQNNFNSFQEVFPILSYD
jgi:hypothetical protein